MKVILLKDVARMGRQGDVKEAPSGHALNYLIPRGLAEVATPASLKRLADRKTKRSENIAASQETFANSLEKLSQGPVELPVEANEQGHLFRGVKEEDISTHLAALGAPIPVESIELPHPLKALGTHEIRLTSSDSAGTFQLVLVKK